MPELVTIGETMVVFDGVSAGPLRYISNYTCHTGGAESNVAVGVVRQGHSAGWISSLGDDEFGMLIRRTYLGEGVDLSHVVTDKQRSTGIFFRQANGNGEYKNFYYRKNSAGSAICPEMLDEEYIASAKILHITGITLAASRSAADTCIKAMQIAKGNGVKVTFDPNIRLKMWSADAAREMFDKIWKYVDIVLPGIDEGELLYGTKNPDEFAEIMQSKGVETIIIKVGADGCIGYENGQRTASNGFKVKHVADTFGAGDSFAAGIISGYLKGWSLESTMQYANAIGAMVVSSPGNIEAIPTYEEVIKFISGEDISAASR